MLKILVVDDDALSNETFKRLLESLLSGEYEIHSMNTGNDVVEKIETQGYDIVFLDNKLPGKDGISILKEVYTKKIDANIVLLTGSDDEKIVDNASKFGAADVISKGNFDITRIVDILASNACVKINT